jgi:subtilisin family serine protease
MGRMRTARVDYFYSSANRGLKMMNGITPAWRVIGVIVLGLSCGPSLAAPSSPDRVRVIVSFKAGASLEVRAAVARLGGSVVVGLDEVDALAVLVPPGALAALQANPKIESVEPDALLTIQGARGAGAGASAAGPVGMPGATSSGQVVPYGITQVQADQLAGTPKWTPKVCIVDSGIHGRHEDLSGNLATGTNFTDSGSWDTDEDSHGTHVAGTIAALNNGLGVVGVNGDKQIALHIAKVFGPNGGASRSLVMRAALHCAAAGSNIISMSLGGPIPSIVETKVFDSLVRRGILTVAAAGNGGGGTLYPAGYPSVMSVAASDVNRTAAWFTTHNADVEISAPGLDVLSTIPPNIFSLAQLSVNGTPYPALALLGSPRLAASAPLADFGIGYPASPLMAGKICLIQRGLISLLFKVLSCQMGGGLGAIIYNDQPGDLQGSIEFGAMAASPDPELEPVPTIPAIGVSQADGALLLTRLGQTAAMVVVPDPALYAYFWGTSMATPHVSGVAARVWGYYPECSGEQIRASLKLSALDIMVPGRDDYSGAGIVQARAAFDRIATLGCGK